LEVEGEEDSHWLNELADEEEDEEIPLLAGFLGGAKVAPKLSLMTRRTEPLLTVLNAHI